MMVFFIRSNLSNLFAQAFMSNEIFHIHNRSDFTEVALRLFREQAKACAVYRDYIQLLGIRPEEVHSLEEIPYLPIEFFKSHEVKTGAFSHEIVFTSSGTTGQYTSQHFVKSLNLYVESFVRGFELFYGPMSQYAVLGLLPAYLERSGSSLVFMVDHMIKTSEHPESGFYLNNHDSLYTMLLKLREKGVPTLLIGVTFGLLDFSATFQIDFPELIVMETGGMKGRRQEMIRDEVHALLKDAFGVANIHSEYGMTELLSQAYSNGFGYFKCPPWMAILRREVTDPFCIDQTPGSGALNVIDLANRDSCSFIATQDLVRLHDHGRFEIMGRYDHAEVRGCNLMVI